MILKLFFPALLSSGLLTAGAQSKIVVQINNFRNNKGACIVCLYDNAKAFSGKGEPLRTLRVMVADKAAAVVFTNVPAGTYAISVVHDANNNNRFDTNFIGIPTEGYGASQNKLPFAAAPNFDDNKFSVHLNTNTAVNIKLRYLL
jgi:uncharacterized protein (DUF2141 family)